MIYIIYVLLNDNIFTDLQLNNISQRYNFFRDHPKSTEIDIDDGSSKTKNINYQKFIKSKLNHLKRSGISSKKLNVSTDKEMEDYLNDDNKHH